MTLFKAFLDSPAGAGLLAMVAVAFLDFATGSFAALRDGTFTLDVLGAFLRKHIWGRVAPIGLLLVAGYFGGGIIGPLFMTAAIAGAAAYVSETAASVFGNINPPVDAKSATEAEIINPVPTD